MNSQHWLDVLPFRLNSDALHLGGDNLTEVTQCDRAHILKAVVLHAFKGYSHILTMTYKENKSKMGKWQDR